MSKKLPVCLWQLGAELGEGPVWMAPEQALYFVDIKGQLIHRCKVDGTDAKSWPSPKAIGFLQPLADGDFVAGLQDGLYRFNPNSGSFNLIHSVEPLTPGNRLNDAYVDPQGRLWFGTMDNDETNPSGSLYRFDASKKLTAIDTGYVITNGPALSPDGKTFYHTDTLSQTVYAFDCSAQGQLSRKRVLLTTRNGYPDGTTVDSAGHLWIALFGGHRIERYSDKGILIESIYFPCGNVTKIAFGGADLCTAFVTTACKGLTSQQRAQRPFAGGLFTFQVDTPGLPQHTISEGFSSWLV